jgi:hypothetical protein
MAEGYSCKGIFYSRDNASARREHFGGITKFYETRESALSQADVQISSRKGMFNILSYNFLIQLIVKLYYFSLKILCEY